VSSKHFHRPTSQGGTHTRSSWNDDGLGINPLGSGADPDFDNSIDETLAVTYQGSAPLFTFRGDLSAPNGSVVAAAIPSGPRFGDNNTIAVPTSVITGGQPDSNAGSPILLAGGAAPSIISSVVEGNSLGFTITINFDSSVSNAPSGFEPAVLNAVAFYTNSFTDPINMTIDVGYGEVDGTPLGSGALGESSTRLLAFGSRDYGTIRTDLTNSATSADQANGDSTLGFTDPTGGGTIGFSRAEAKALGIIASDTSVDGCVGFSSSASFNFSTTNRAVAGQYDFIGTVEHEISEVMGRIAGLNQQGFYTIQDLFRYSGIGTRELAGGTPAYFSIDAGTSDLGDFNTVSGADFGDWASNITDDSYLAFSNSGVANVVSTNDLRQMNVLGWARADTTPPSTNVDNPLSVPVGGSGAITSSLLSSTDPDNTAAQLTYTVTTGPSRGALLKSGSPTATFTQADINNGLIAYRENGSNVSSDVFLLTVSDPANNSENASFQILIHPVPSDFDGDGRTDVL